MNARNVSPLRNKATFLGSLLFLGSLAYLYKVAQFPGTDAVRSIGPAFFPNVIGGAFAFLSVLLILEGRRSEPSPLFGGLVPRVNVVRAVALVASLIVVSLFLEFLGFVIVSFVFTLGIQVVLGERSVIRAVLVALIATAVLYGLFIMLLRIPLPRGLLG